MHYKNILVPFDFEAHSREALELARQLAGVFNSAVTIVHAFDPRGYQAPSGYVDYTSAESRDLAASLQAQLNGVAKQFVDAGVARVSARLLEGVPVAALVRFAREEGVDLIVMGTHGRTGVWQKLLGSMAQQVLNEAPCPVMTVRAGVLEAHEKKESSSPAEDRATTVVRGPTPRSSVN